MIAELLGARGDAEQLGGGRAAGGCKAAHGQLAGRESAGLVEDEGVNFRGQLYVGDVLDEDAEAGGGGERGDHRGGRGEDEGARAGDDEDGDDAAQLTRERPHQRADDQHERCVKAHVLVHDAHDRQLGLLGGQDEFAHAVERGVGAGAGDFDFKDTGEVDGAGKRLVAGLLVHREGFTGDVRLVDGAFARKDLAVGSHVVAGADADDIAVLEFVDGDFLFFAADEAPGFGGRELDERLDGEARALGGAALDNLAQQHEEAHDARFLIVPAGEGRENGEGDEFVRSEVAALQVLHRHDDDGPAQHDGSEAGAEVGGSLPVGHEPLDDERVDDEDEAEERDAMLLRGVLVVGPTRGASLAVGVVVFLLAEEAGDLHREFIRVASAQPASTARGSKGCAVRAASHRCARR